MDTPKDLKKMQEKAKAKLLKQEGEALLKAVSATNPATPLLGPDGQPIPKASAGPTKEELLAKRTEKSEKIKELFKHDPVLADLGNAMADLYKALIWVGQDAAAREGMTDELAIHMSQMCQEAVLRQPIVAENLVENLKKFTIPCLVRLKNTYAALRKKQQAKVNRINKDILTKGISTPLALGEAGLPKIRIGESVILRGEKEVVRQAVRQVLAAHENGDKGHTCLLSMVENEKSDKARVVMPPVWWGKCATDIKTLDDILVSAADNVVTALGVDDLGAANENVGQAAARLHTWCVNNLAVGVFGEPSERGEVTFSGPFKRFLVTVSEGVLKFNALTLKGKKDEK